LAFKTNYRPFQIIKGKLNHKNPLELSENQKLCQYMLDHSENIKQINENIYEKLTSQRKKKLGKTNLSRETEIPIDVNKPLFAKSFVQKSKVKEQNKYKKVLNPVIDQENVIIAKNKKIYKNLLKPQRNVVSDATIPSTSIPGTNGYNPVLPISLGKTYVTFSKHTSLYHILTFRG